MADFIDGPVEGDRFSIESLAEIWFPLDDEDVQVSEGEDEDEAK